MSFSKTKIREGECYLWWIFPYQVWKNVSNVRYIKLWLSDNIVEGYREGKGRIVESPMTQRKNTEVLSALPWSCMFVFRVHSLRRKLIAQGPCLDPVSFYNGDKYYCTSLSFYYLNLNSCSRETLGPVGPTPFSTDTCPPS